MTEAERIAQELVEAIDGFPQATKLEQEAAALIRSQAAEIERLREVLRRTTEQLRCNTDNMNKGMSKSIQKLCARENKDVVTAARSALESKHD